jgi:hypothetical protein
MQQKHYADSPRVASGIDPRAVAIDPTPESTAFPLSAIAPAALLLIREDLGKLGLIDMLRQVVFSRRI